MTLLGIAIIVAFVCVILAVAGFFFLRPMYIDERTARALNLTLLSIVLPKEQPKEEASVEMRREKIGIMEQFYATLAGFHPEGFVERLLGHPYFVIEMTVPNVGEEIHFYLAVPKKYADAVEKHIHGFFPEAYVEQADDYTIFHPGSEVAVATATLANASFIPFRTYRELESDPLGEITNALAKLEEHNEGAVIQLIFRPAPKQWNRLGLRVARTMKQDGIEVKKALKKAKGFAIAKELRALFGSAKKKEETSPPPTLTPLQEEMVRAIEEKAHRAAFEVNVRVLAAAASEARARQILEGLVGTFTQFGAPERNSFKFKIVHKKRLHHVVFEYAFRMFSEKERMVLDTAELTSILRFPIGQIGTPRVKFLKAKPASPPADLPRDGIQLGENIYRNVKMPVYMAPEDRRRHLYIIGQTGTGKSTLMENMIRQDIARGYGVAVIDPHGDLVEHVLGYVPKERAEEVVYFDPSDTARPVGLNMLDAGTPAEQDFAVQEMITIFYKLFPPEMIGPMFEHNMRNAMLTLMADRASPGTLVDIPRIFTDDAFVQEKLKSVTDPLVRAFWEKEMKKTTDYHKSEMLGYLISKVGRFVENSMMRNIIGQARSGFDFSQIMNTGKILLVNLSKGKVGEVNSSLLGLVIVSKLQMAAMRRAEMEAGERRDFYLYIDEFQNYTTDSIATILSEARKYRLNLVMAHQFIKQLRDEIRDAVFGNVGSLISFRVGADDAEFLEKQFEPVFNQGDLINIDNFHAYIKLLIRNRATAPFNMQIIPPVLGDASRVDTLRSLSRLKYGRDREEVEEEIYARSQLGMPVGVTGMEGEVRK